MYRQEDTNNEYMSPTRQQEVAEDDEIRDYLLQLDMLRQECERGGNFLKAQECVNRMREVNLRYAKKVELRSRQANVVTKHKTTQEQKLELLTFSRMWEEKLREYDQRAELLVHDIKKTHTLDYRNQEAELRLHIMNKRPRFSKQVMELRTMLEKYVAQRRYVEAEEVKQKLARQEQMELHLFDDQLANAFEKKAAHLKDQYLLELRAAEQKIAMGREELLGQRQLDFERLMKKHTKNVKEIESQTKLHVAKTQNYVKSQVKALVLDPLKTGMDLGGVERTFREGQGKQHASSPWRATILSGQQELGSARRARTPPAGRRTTTPTRGMTITPASSGGSRMLW